MALNCFKICCTNSNFKRINSLVIHENAPKKKNNSTAWYEVWRLVWWLHIKPSHTTQMGYCSPLGDGAGQAVWGGSIDCKACNKIIKWQEYKNDKMNINYKW